jgi:uncharacterized protein (UPF0332 family)
MAAFDWGEYLTLAGDLATAPEERAKRSSVSRAYYYVYHLALARAVSNGFVAVEGGMHKQLWGLYRGVPAPDCQELGLLGERLKLRRERADYHDTYPRLNEEVTEVLAEARDFAVRLARVDARHPNPASRRQ